MQRWLNIAPAIPREELSCHKNVLNMEGSDCSIYCASSNLEVEHAVGLVEALDEDVTKSCCWSEHASFHRR